MGSLGDSSAENEGPNNPTYMASPKWECPPPLEGMVQIYMTPKIEEQGTTLTFFLCVYFCCTDGEATLAIH